MPPPFRSEGGEEGDAAPAPEVPRTNQTSTSSIFERPSLSDILDRSESNDTSPMDTSPSDHSAYLSALHQIDQIPVPDLASTLTSTPPETRSVDGDADADGDAEMSNSRTEITEPSIFTSANQLSERIRMMNAAMEARIINNSMGSPSRNWSTSTSTGTGTGGRDEIRLAELMEQHRQRIARMTSTWRTLSSTAAAAGEPIPDAEERTSRLERVLQHVGYMQERTLEEAEMQAQAHAQAQAEAQAQVQEQIEAQMQAQEQAQAQAQQQAREQEEETARMRREAQERRAAFGDSRRLNGSLSERVGLRNSTATQTTASTASPRRLALARRYSSAASRRHGNDTLDGEWDDLRRDGSASPPRSLRSHPPTGNGDISAEASASERLSAVRTALDQMRRRNLRLATGMGMDTSYHRRMEEYADVMDVLTRRREEHLRQQQQSRQRDVGTDSNRGTGTWDDPPARLRSMYRASGDYTSENQDNAGSSTSRLTPSASMARVSLSYLSNLRNATNEKEARECASASGYSLKDIQGPSFILNLYQLPRPQPTSLLAPGATFTGSQYANTFPPDYLLPNFTPSNMMQHTSLSSSLATGSSTYSSLSSLAPTRGPPSSYVPCPWPTSRYQSRNNHEQDPLDSFGRSGAGNSAIPSSGSDHWPVKVTIFHVDHERLTLTASMEAYDVPPLVAGGAVASPTSSNATPNTATFAPNQTTRKAIATYVEGEIIDFRTRTLVTESFSSKVDRDIMYWRKLAPFKNVPLAELPARLLSKDFLAEVMEKYVLMRWKERCFVDGDAPSTGNGYDGCGLTISGFYYVCMRREDGMVEGLYCDPQSNPYQYLRLARERGGMSSSWEFA